MIREHLFSKTGPTDRWFRWRGGQVSRVEALSDGVFAVALAFLVVTTLSAPRTYAELLLSLRHAPALAACFAMMMFLWYAHHLFFRRYGLEDAWTVTINAAFLFVILVYVYPLRFLASALFWMFSGGALSPQDVPYIGPGEGRWMMPAYSAGVVLVFALLWLLHWRAWRLRRELELDEIEEHLTKASMASHTLSAGIGLVSLSIAVAAPERSALAGWIYFLMGPLHGVLGWRVRSRLEAIGERVARADSGGAAVD